MEYLIGHFNVYIYIVLILLGFYTMMAEKNLIKKIIGMNIFQWSIILFVISLASKIGGTIPIIKDFHHGDHPIVHANDYINPLPHVLMLTAIVVGVATTGVALALVIRIHKTYGTIEEDELAKRVK